jgi:hypothetical protein
MRAGVISGRAPIFVLKSVWGCLWYPRTYGTFPISAVAGLNECCPVLSWFKQGLGLRTRPGESTLTWARLELLWLGSCLRTGPGGSTSMHPFLSLFLFLSPARKGERLTL